MTTQDLKEVQARLNLAHHDLSLIIDLFDDLKPDSIKSRLSTVKGIIHDARIGTHQALYQMEPEA